MIFEKLKTIIIGQLGVEDEEVTPESTFRDDLGCDSLDIVELIMAVEEEFDMEIHDDDVLGIDTVGQAVEFIEKHNYMQ